MRLVVKIPDQMGAKLKHYADGHPVYDGNVSALIRALAVLFFAQQDTSKWHTLGERAPVRRKRGAQ